MSEYIPTTEEVRQGFADNSFTFMSHEGVTIQVATKWFDHWLEQHDAEVAKVTEQRIIKLLRTELGPYLIWADDTPYIKGINLDGFIALIEGEGEKQTGKEFDYFETSLEGENK